MPYKIAEARKAKGWTQKELADRLGTTQQVVYKWEHGINDPRADVMVRMAAALGVTLSYLLGVDDNGNEAYSADERELLDLYRSTDTRSTRTASCSHCKRRSCGFVASSSRRCRHLA